MRALILALLLETVQFLEHSSSLFRSPNMKKILHGLKIQDGVEYFLIKYLLEVWKMCVAGVICLVIREVL